ALPIWGWRGRSERRAAKVGLSAGSGRYRDLAFAGQSFAHGGFWLRYFGLPRNSSPLRYDEGFRPAAKGGSPARNEVDHRSGSQSYLGSASLVPRVAFLARQSQTGLVPVVRSSAGRRSSK